jgi:beta-ureidopropionase
VVWPSAYDGGFSLQAYAWTHGYHVVSAVSSAHAKVIDISGQVLASTSRWHRLATTTIDLEKELFHVAVCLGQHERLFRLQEELGPRVTVRGFSEENVVTVESNDPEWPLARIKETYSLLNFHEYHEASRAVHAEHRRPLVSLPV